MVKRRTAADVECFEYPLIHLRPCHPHYSDIILKSSITTLRELAASIVTATRVEHTDINTDSEGIVFREPYGVCLAMAPWNAALILAVRAFATPIIAGNTVLFKTSEISPATHALFGQLMKDAGLPDGVLNIVNIDVSNVAEYAEKMISDKRIRHVNFTGSTRVGSIISSLAGKYIKPAILELGGKAPVIVLEDANLEVAATHSILGGWIHQGQVCMSTEKVIVVDSIYDKFVALLKETASDSHLVGTPLGQAIPAGSIKAKKLVDDAVRDGATLLLGPHGAVNVNHMTPCILTDVTPAMEIYSEETFAPIFIILRAKDEDEAVHLANDTDYGLSSSIFTANEKKAIELGRRIDAGATHVNFMTVLDVASLPHGGMKASGYGRFNGVEGIRSFTQTKVITLHGQGHALPV